VIKSVEVPTNAGDLGSAYMLRGVIMAGPVSHLVFEHPVHAPSTHVNVASTATSVPPAWHLPPPTEVRRFAGCTREWPCIAADDHPDDRERDDRPESRTAPGLRLGSGSLQVKGYDAELKLGRASK
jgi:hypothetical protein